MPYETLNQIWFFETGNIIDGGDKRTDVSDDLEEEAVKCSGKN